MSEMVTARLTPGEREALGELLRLRAAEMEQNDMPGDASFAGWLRAVIRREAKAAGVMVESPHVIETPKPKRARGRRTNAG